jgi:hypothetical protein
LLLAAAGLVTFVHKTLAFKKLWHTEKFKSSFLEKFWKNVQTSLYAKARDWNCLKQKLMATKEEQLDQRLEIFVWDQYLDSLRKAPIWLQTLQDRQGLLASVLKKTKNKKEGELLPLCERF